MILHFFNRSPSLFFFFLSGATRLCRCCWKHMRIENEERSNKKKVFFFFLINRYCIFFFFFYFTDFYDCRIRGHAQRPPPPGWGWSHLCSWPAVTPAFMWRLIKTGWVCGGGFRAARLLFWRGAGTHRCWRREMSSERNFGSRCVKIIEISLQFSGFQVSACGF